MLSLKQLPCNTWSHYTQSANNNQPCEVWSLPSFRNFVYAQYIYLRECI